MEDRTILGLFLSREKDAIGAAANKYGGLCRRLAENILGSPEDGEECFNDTLFRLWNEIPPKKPENLGAYAARITRNLALDRLRERSALRRGGGRTAECLHELEDCLPDDSGDFADRLALRDALNGFLSGLKPEARQIFVKRYWYMESVSVIAREMGLGESKVKMSLMRSREALKTKLQQEGFDT